MKKSKSRPPAKKGKNSPAKKKTSKGSSKDPKQYNRKMVAAAAEQAMGGMDGGKGNPMVN